MYWTFRALSVGQNGFLRGHAPASGRPSDARSRQPESVRISNADPINLSDSTGLAVVIEDSAFRANGVHEDASFKFLGMRIKCDAEYAIRLLEALTVARQGDPFRAADLIVIATEKRVFCQTGRWPGEPPFN